MLDLLEQKLVKAERHASRQKKRYWALRRKVIQYLGGGCMYCGDFIEENLEIHHVEPLLESPKQKGGGRGSRGGAARIREWKLILAGKLEAHLCCKRCHQEIEHAPGTPNSISNLRKGAGHE